MEKTNIIRRFAEFGIVCLLLALFSGISCSAVTLSSDNLTLSGPGMSGSSSLVIDTLPEGIAGFKINATLTTSGVARITGAAFPPAFSAMKSNSSLPAEEVRVVAVDLAKAVEPGSSNVTLCTVTIEGLSDGTSGLSLSVGELTDDDGNPITCTLNNGLILVGSVSPTPTPTQTPTQTPTTTPTVTQTITPTPTPTTTPVPGTIDFSATPRTGSSPLTVSFIPDASAPVLSYVWSFGDGTGSDQMNPTHVYHEGTYNVTLLVTFSAGGSASASKPEYIIVNSTGPTPTPTSTPVPTPTPAPLVANFTASPQSGVPPLSVQFTDLSAGTPLKWKWNFGDGTMATTQNPLHVYGGIGRYTVTLEVENRDYSDIIRKREYVKTSSKK
jgi:PKD repeat protein